MQSSVASHINNGVSPTGILSMDHSKSGKAKGRKEV